jgi:hypothetical protein
MRIRSVAFLALLALVSSVGLAEETVRLTKESETVKVTIGDEVFTVFNFQPKWKKPFFLPVAAAGGVELLKKELGGSAANPGDPGDTVLVVAETAPIVDGDEARGQASYGETLTVDEVKGTMLHVPAKKGWIRSIDVVPHKAMVARLINENPPGEKNSKSPLYYDHPHHRGSGSRWMRSTGSSSGRSRARSATTASKS